MLKDMKLNFFNLKNGENNVIFYIDNKWFKWEENDERNLKENVLLNNS